MKATWALLSSHAKTASSKRWLQRQNRDPFVKQARTEQYRSRSAFKLLQINERVRCLVPGATVVDLGAAPGGWSQVAAKLVQPNGRVVGADLLPIEPIAGVTLLQLDMRKPEGLAALQAALVPSLHADVVLSDMAPSFSGDFTVDEARHTDLCEAALAVALQLLHPRAGTLVMKALQGPAEIEMFARLQTRFSKVRRLKPDASRQESRELYLVAQTLHAPRNIDKPKMT